MGVFSASGGGDDDDVGDVERPHALPVVVLNRVFDSAHAREVPLNVTHTVVLAELLGCRTAQRRLELTQVPAKQVDDNGLRGGQLGEDLSGLDRCEDDGLGTVGFCVLDVADDVTRTLDGVDERNRMALERDTGEVGEQRAAECLSGDAGAVGHEIGGARRRCGVERSQINNEAVDNGPYVADVRGRMECGRKSIAKLANRGRSSPPGQEVHGSSSAIGEVLQLRCCRCFGGEPQFIRNLRIDRVGYRGDHRLILQLVRVELNKCRGNMSEAVAPVRKVFVGDHSKARQGRTMRRKNELRIVEGTQRLERGQVIADRVLRLRENSETSAKNGVAGQNGAGPVLATNGSIVGQLKTHRV